jgi:catechol 2,3-dioxygenase-like lactoylglutathione lyase family enzyme
VRPRRLSHVLLFSSDVSRSVRFYSDALGLRLSDRSGDVIAFMHGAHASDHHMLAFAKSGGPGLHHSSWIVESIDEIGLGMQHMADCGYVRSWGVGRHVIGSNYFCYIQDPWGSFAEYSHDIDFVPADVEWQSADHPLEDSFYVWGPPPPDYFIVNHEIAPPAA